MPISASSYRELDRRLGRTRSGCSLPTAYCPPPTAYCLLLTAYSTRPRVADNLERLALDAPELLVEVPDPHVRGDRDGPVDPVVGDEHPVHLEGGEDGP